MAIENDVLTQMYVQIVNGTDKADSQHVTDDETAAAWDDMEQKHAREAAAFGPGVVFESVNH